jgi:ATP-dependent RNA helicase SUPV3L1/SUV3
MGLNLSLRHVAFAGLSKFDGQEDRPLDAAELGQIAGRAGRHLEDGTFGTLAPVPALSEGLRRRIELSQFDDVRKLTWRNGDLCLDNLDELEGSLTARPRVAYLTRPRQSSDLEALRALRRDRDVSRRAQGSEAVATLWQACQIPDYQQWVPQLHAALVKEVFLQLVGPGRVLESDWLHEQMTPLDDVSGDLDALTARITATRTSTSLCNKSEWVRDAHYWKARASQVERRLSDALHDKLVERFVETRKASSTGSIAARSDRPERTRSDDPFSALVELRRKLEGPPPSVRRERRVEALCSAPHHELHFDDSGRIRVGEDLLGRLVRGADLLRPEVRVELDDLTPSQRLRLSRRLLAWSRDRVDEVVGPLRADRAQDWSPAARGLAYQLEQSLGSVAAVGARAQLTLLTADDRVALAARGVVLGREVVFLERSLKPRQRRARIAIAQAHSVRVLNVAGSLAGRAAFPVPAEVEPSWLERIGFVVLGELAVRADMVHRVSELLAGAARDPRLVPAREISQWLGCHRDGAARLIEALGYRPGPAGRLAPQPGRRDANRGTAQAATRRARGGRRHRAGARPANAKPPAQRP